MNYFEDETVVETVAEFVNDVRVYDSHVIAHYADCSVVMDFFYSDDASYVAVMTKLMFGEDLDVELLP